MGLFTQTDAQIADEIARLSAARQGLLERYAAWRDGLEEYGDLWALAELAAASPASGDRRAA